MIGVMFFMFIGFACSFLLFAIAGHLLEKKVKALQIEVEHLKNVMVVLNARSLMCRNKLELVESGLDQLLVEKFSGENSGVIQ